VLRLDVKTVTARHRGGRQFAVLDPTGVCAVSLATNAVAIDYGAAMAYPTDAFGEAVPADNAVGNPGVRRGRRPRRLLRRRFRTARNLDPEGQRGGWDELHLRLRCLPSGQRLRQRRRRDVSATVGGNTFAGFPRDVVIDRVYFAAVVPEPETYALMLASLGVVAFMARRRKA
jgi:hypothetical protein